MQVVVSIYVTDGASFKTNEFLYHDAICSIITLIQAIYRIVINGRYIHW